MAQNVTIQSQQILKLFDGVISAELDDGDGVMGKKRSKKRRTPHTRGESRTNHRTISPLNTKNSFYYVVTYHASAPNMVKADQLTHSSSLRRSNISLNTFFYIRLQHYLEFHLYEWRTAPWTSLVV